MSSVRERLPALPPQQGLGTICVRQQHVPPVREGVVRDFVGNRERPLGTSSSPLTGMWPPPTFITRGVESLNSLAVSV